MDIHTLRGADSRTGKVARVGAKIRRYYVGTPSECWSCVDDATEYVTRESIARGDTDPALVPPIEIVVNGAVSGVKES